VENLVREHIQKSIETKNELISKSTGLISNAGHALSEVLNNNKKILLCGNGGSAADAQHIAAELVVRYKGGNERRALPAMTLSSDPSTITACGNDYGYEQLFSRSVEAFGEKGDALIAISTSGNSINVIKAVESAKEKNMVTVGLLGGNGGHLTGKTDFEIIVPSDITAHIQESHITIGHILCRIIEKRCFNLD
jgi:D-sedoheptulose 7-phosphate isomerase